MKKHLALALALVMALSFGACGENGTSSAADAAAGVSQQEQAPAAGTDAAGSTQEAALPTASENSGSAQEASVPASDVATGASASADNANASQAQTEEITDPGSMDLGILQDFFSSETGVLFSQMRDEEKQEMIENGKMRGMEVTFNSDDSTTITRADGTVMTQTPDGKFIYTTPDGVEGSLGGGWPDNEYTRLVPKPPILPLTTGIEGESFVATFLGISGEQMDVYIQQVKAAGFTVDAEEGETDIDGIPTEVYGAYNAFGNLVEILFMESISTGIVAITQ